jgi:hypothetical protein
VPRGLAAIGAGCAVRVQGGAAGREHERVRCQEPHVLDRGREAEICALRAGRAEVTRAGDHSYMVFLVCPQRRVQAGRFGWGKAFLPEDGAERDD